MRAVLASQRTLLSLSTFSCRLNRTIDMDRETAYAQFVLDLDSQSVLNGAKNRLGATAASEISYYQAEIARIESETRESDRTIASLKQQLALAQQERKNKIVYDSIAKEALKVPTRAHSAEYAHISRSKTRG